VRLRIAAAGDVHARADSPRLGVLAEAFARAAREADLLALAGDLTDRGRPEEAAALGALCRGLPVPVVAVLGNADHRAGRGREVAAALERSGVVVLERGHCRLALPGGEVGVVGTTGCPGGFPDAPLEGVEGAARERLRALAAEEAEALDAGLQAVAGCATRVALLHYAPTRDTLMGEPEDLHARLGCARLAEPLAAHAPHVVLHAHAHRGRFRGTTAGVPTYNVSSDVLGREVCLLELVLDPAPAA
jgi:uncharacterized protein